MLLLHVLKSLDRMFVLLNLEELVMYKCEHTQWDEDTQTYVCPYKEANEDKGPNPLMCPKSSLTRPLPMCMNIRKIENDWDH
jgi:hypothetical protein